MTDPISQTIILLFFNANAFNLITFIYPRTENNLRDFPFKLFETILCILSFTFLLLDIFLQESKFHILLNDILLQFLTNPIFLFNFFTFLLKLLLQLLIVPEYPFLVLPQSFNFLLHFPLHLHLLPHNSLDFSFKSLVLLFKCHNLCSHFIQDWFVIRYFCLHLFHEWGENIKIRFL